jgi:hypothetical protein
MLLLGAAGLIFILHRRLVAQQWPLLVTFGYLSVFPVLTVAMDRYHVPIDPLLAMFAAYALLVMRERISIRAVSLPDVQHPKS